MKVLTWLAFVGLMIEGGAILVSYIVSCIKPEASQNLYIKLNWLPLKQYDFVQYSIAVFFILALPVIKAVMAYMVIIILSGINLTSPFTITTVRRIETISYLLLAAWIVAVIQHEHYQWLLKRMGEKQTDSSVDEYLFIAGLVFIISQIFKRGVELQAENDLTV